MVMPNPKCSNDPPESKTHNYNYFFTEGNDKENHLAMCLNCGLIITIHNVGKYFNAEEVE